MMSIYREYVDSYSYD